MKKVFGLFLSIIVLMGLSACEVELPDEPQKPNPEPIPEETGCLTFVSSGESLVALAKVGEPFDISLEYSLDGKSWNPYTIRKAIYLLDGGELSFRAGETGNERFSKGSWDNYRFIISGSVSAKGNIMSLLDRSCRKNAVPANAFFYLFCDCTGLTEAPKLPATELAEGCYTRMFEGCANISKAPALPAVKLAERCYEKMFFCCKSLTKAPELPATVMKSGCYRSMFAGCTSLTKAPELPATELAEYCYGSMFAGCTSLNYVKALFTDEPSKETTASWLSSVSSTGTFVKNKYATWDVRGDDGIPEGWTIESDAGTSDDSQKPNPDESLCLTFVSSGESTITLIKIGDPSLITLEYSTNGSIWNPYTIGDSISLLDGEKLMFRAGKDGNDYFSLNSSHYYNFKISGSVAAKGNIMSLLDRSCHKKIVPSHAFNSLFKYCEALTSAPTLSATKLGNNCYYCMFRGCTSLTEAPALPAKVMAKVCYSGMFWGCTSLMKAPELPAMELAEYCYAGMFRDCTSLTEAPELSATELASSCYGSMFKGCTSLTKAPVLPATELARACYSGMFQGCMILNYVKALFTDEPSKETTREWLLGVSPTGTFVKSKDATWDVRGENGIPDGWTVVTE